MAGCKLPHFTALVNTTTEGIICLAHCRLYKSLLLVAAGRCGEREEVLQERHQVLAAAPGGGRLAGQQGGTGVGGVKIDRQIVCRPPVRLPAHCQAFPHAALVLTRLWPTPLYSPQAHFNMGNLYRQCAEFGRAIQRCAWLAGWRL